MRATCIALGLLALIAVTHAAEVDAETAKHSHKNKHGSYKEGTTEYPGYNMPYDHVQEHVGPCTGSRHVTAAQAPLPCLDGQNQIQNNCPNPQFCGEPDGQMPPLYPIDTCNCQEGKFYRYGVDEVVAHFKNQPGPFPMVSAKRQSFECVDARGDQPMLGTPGGDLAEVMAATMALLKLKNQLPDTDAGRATIEAVFNIFANCIASKERPLYFHTNDGSLRKLFAFLKTRGTFIDRDIVPSIFPWKAPEDTAVSAAWLKNLARPEYNGCGHIRLQLQDDTSKDYSVVKDQATVTACSKLLPAPPGIDITDPNCISAKSIAEQIIKKYFEFWWFSADNSPQRRKVAFSVEGVLEGPLLGKAVTIIQKDEDGDGDECPGFYPLIRPTFAASQVFTYHAEAITDFRKYATEKFFAQILDDNDIAPSVFLANWQNITDVQLGATLADLTPANRLGIFTVNVTVSPIDGSHGHHHHHHHKTSGHHYYSTDYTPEESNYDDSY